DPDFRQELAAEAMKRWADRLGLERMVVRHDQVTAPWLSYRRAIRLLSDIGFEPTPANLKQLREFSLKLGRLPDDTLRQVQNPARLYRDALWVGVDPALAVELRWPPAQRSEERRVGKEWSCWRSRGR